MIIAFRNENRSLAEIVKKMEEFGVRITRVGVKKVIDKYEATGTVARRRGSGRKPKTTPADDRQLKRDALRNRKKSITALSKEFVTSAGENISRFTIRRRLGEQGLRSYRCRKVPMLSKVNKCKRVAWCKKYEKLDFGTVVWSDESRFCLVSDRPQTCIRRRGEEFLPECTQKTVKGNEGIMVWGCFSKSGIGELCLIPKGQTVNAAKYRDILSNSLLPSLESLHRNGEYVFQQDNAPCHTARTVWTWFEDNNVVVMEDWPPQSPDLNPIENLWDHVERQIQNVVFKNLEELWNKVREVWYSIPQDFINKLVDSMKRRISACSQNKGGHTRY